MASISIPKQPGDAFSISYLLPDALHDRQRNNMSIDTNGEMTKFNPFNKQEHLGKRIYQSMYELHTGDWFGTPGRIVNMVASMIMPLFTITGFLLYLDRRRKKQGIKQAAKKFSSASEILPDYLVVYASQSGTSEHLAWRTAHLLNKGGIAANVKPLAEMNSEILISTQKILFLLSTFGEGEAPDSARKFIRNCMGSATILDNLRFGLLALGDKCYRDYCGFAVQVEQWLVNNGAQSIFERINVDKNDERAIRQWEDEIVKLGGVAASQSIAADYTPWTLIERRLLNPGSVGNAIYSINLQSTTTQNWQAGDILEIAPQHAPAKVQQFLTEHQLDGHKIINGITLYTFLATHVFPREYGGKLTAWINTLKPLASRKYSIASIPKDGKVELVVRQAFTDNGEIGLGSGWLTRFATEGNTLLARIRRNPAFHCQAGPIIFIGAGTGIAGLRAHLKARAAMGEHRNWLIFGERQRAYDRLYGEEFDQWLHNGIVQRLDEVYSRDLNLYVQDRLLEEAERVREWVNQNAAIYICGSMAGMAVGVEKALIQILGDHDFNMLRDTGRYRRDIY